MTAPVPPAAPEAPKGVEGSLDALRAALTKNAGTIAEPTPALAAPEAAPLTNGVPQEIDPTAVTGQAQGKPEGEAEQAEGETPETPPEPTEEERAAAEAERQARTVVIPEWRPGEAPIEIEAESPEAAERLRALVNSRELKVEGEERLAESRQQMDRVHEFRAAWRADPVGTASKMLDQDQQAHLALSIVTNPKMLDLLGPTLAAVLQDPRELEVLRSKLDAEGLRLQQRAGQELQLEKAQRRNIEDLRRTVDALVPPGFSGAQRQQWRQDALRELGDYAERSGARILDPRDVPVLLAARLRASNVDPQAAADTILRTFQPRRAQDPAGTPSRPPAPASVEPQKLVQAAKARQVAATSAPPGAGAPTASLPPAPPGSGIQGRLDHYAKQRNIRR